MPKRKLILFIKQCLGALISSKTEFLTLLYVINARGGRVLMSLCTRIPAGTPYEGGVFRMRLSIPSDFPSTAPKGAPRVIEANSLLLSALNSL